MLGKASGYPRPESRKSSETMRDVLPCSVKMPTPTGYQKYFPTPLRLVVGKTKTRVSGEWEETGEKGPPRRRS